MGGVLIIVSIVIPTLLWADLRNSYVWIAVFALVAYGADRLSWTITQSRPSSRNLGLTARRKMLYQVGMAFAGGGRAAVHAHVRRLLHGHERAVLQALQAHSADFESCWRIPGPIRSGVLPFFVFVALVIVGASNAVNLTDGLDGLAIGLMVIAVGRDDGADLRRRPRRAGRVSADRAQRAHLGADHFLRRDDRREPGLPLVQRASGRDLHGRRRLARRWAARWRSWRC